jgi:hypothetical protein
MGIISSGMRVSSESRRASKRFQAPGCRMMMPDGRVIIQGPHGRLLISTSRERISFPAKGSPFVPKLHAEKVLGSSCLSQTQQDAKDAKGAGITATAGTGP